MNFRTGRMLVAAALLAAVCTPCFGQAGGRGARGGRAGGMMAGGMMGGGGDMMLLGLLRIEEVQKEIDMMADQVEAIGKIGEQLRDTPRPEAGFDFREATEEQRESFMVKMREFAETQGKKVTEQLEEVLLPEQLERARQIALQAQGMQAFSDPTFIKKIGLTEAQQEKLKAQQEGMREKMGTAMREAAQSGDRDSIRAKIEEMRDESFKEAKSVLTEEQKKKYDEMLGKPFELPEGAMRGGFGGGRGPGGQGGPGGGGGGRGGRGGRDGNAPGGNDA
jgi:hypothetical protein